MCGITGIVNLNDELVSKQVLDKMTDILSHRGPDDRGTFIHKKVGFGHRRLSIIDISSKGKQPMISEDGNFVISYNGELYNFQELRNKLEKIGYLFKSKTDTEVILYSWIEWGEKCLDFFNGMFSFSIYEKSKNNVFLVRDRYGIKPLYFGLFDNTILFSSEQKSILLHPKVSKEIDYEALLEYFTFQNIFTKKTFLKNISLLPPGTVTKISLKEKKIQSRIYWDFKFKENNSFLKKDDYLEELDFLIKQAIKRQLVGDVEIGSYLSGGMDSGTIAYISSLNLTSLKTFTCGFDVSTASGLELAFDERKEAKIMAKEFNSEHHEIVLSSGDMEACLSKLAYHLEEPRVGQSYPNYYAANLASKHVKVVLSGTGGDEIFGGYPWRYYRSKGLKNFQEFIDSYYLFWQRLIDNRDLKKVFSPVANEINGVWTKDIFKNIFKDSENDLKKPEDFINHSLYLESKTFLHGLLVVEDKLSMSHGLETRIPFLDNDLVDFALQCPVKLKINKIDEIDKIDENEWKNKKQKYFKKTRDGKQILRDVMKNYIPKSIVEAEKQGFSSPDASWFKGESINFVRDKLINSNAFIYNFMDKKSVHNLINEHLEGKKNRRLLIWSLLNTETYLSQLFN